MSEGAAKKEEKPRKFQAIRGTRDLLPPETALWNRVEQTAHEVFGTFGFGEIRVPVFELTELFARAVGGETDIVSKEMFSFSDPFDPQRVLKSIAQKALQLGLGVDLETFAASQGNSEKINRQNRYKLGVRTLRSVRKLRRVCAALTSSTGCSNCRSL